MERKEDNALIPAVDSAAAAALLERQKLSWPLVATNYKALEEVKVKDFELDGFRIRVQFNPSRIVSSGAKVDPRSIRERKCFLCRANLPEEQETLDLGGGYLLLCNPYPIFTGHYTIPSLQHTPQSILPRFNDFLRLIRQLDGYTVFYNGPKCGASAPDHVHFQAGTRSQMPIDDEIDSQVRTHGRLLSECPAGSLWEYMHYLRNGFVIKAKTPEVAASYFRLLYRSLEIRPDETEPMMNLIGLYREGEWTVIMIPRKLHRPWQYSAEGEERFLSSPGAADLGGLFITSRPEDFEKVTPEIVRDIFRQVCYSDEEIERVGQSLVFSGK